MNKTAAHKSSVSVQIIGLHVGGVSTHKTSLVRGRCVLKKYQSGSTDLGVHETICNRLQMTLGKLPWDSAGAHFHFESSESSNSPLFWEAFSTEIGPVPHSDPDSFLLEKISDLGGAQVFCLDAPLSFPTCTACLRDCPGVSMCPEPAVQGMIRLWNEDKQFQEKRSKMPLPHTERFFEAYARRRYEHSTWLGILDLESALSSNKAPLTARAHHLSRRLKQLFPNAIVLETHPWLAAMGWALHSGYRLNQVSELRQPDAGRIYRAGLLKKIELEKIALRSATFMEDLFVELSDHVELFAASMSALSAWGLLNGLVDIQPSFLNQGQGDIMTGWALVPRELATYGWGH